MPIVKGPSKAPGTILIVLGVLASFVAAPILFFVLMFQGITGIAENMAAGAVVSNGGNVEVGANGSYTVSLSPDKASSCALINASNQSFEMKQLQGSAEVYYLDGLAQGTYRIQCQGLPSTARITGLPASGEDMVTSTSGAFLWSTVVGVTGIVLLIVGIVLVVRAGSKTKELQQQAMMSAMY
jgi:putative membrane protein